MPVVRRIVDDDGSVTIVNSPASADREADELLRRALAAAIDATGTAAQRFAAGLDALAADSQNAWAAYAAAVLRGNSAARVIDDAALLDQVDALARAGKGRAAVAIVARRAARSPDDVAAIERRLRRKRRRRETDTASSVSKTRIG